MRISEARLVVRWADNGGSHELMLQDARDLRIRRVVRPRRPWRQRRREDLVVTFVDAGPSGSFVTANEPVDVTANVSGDGGQDWLGHIGSLPRDDRDAA